MSFKSQIRFRVGIHWPVLNRKQEKRASGVSRDVGQTSGWQHLFGAKDGTKQPRIGAGLILTSSRAVADCPTVVLPG
jgi:hypothetical protein